MISTKFLTHRYLENLLATFLQNHFPSTFGGHLDFLRKTQKSVYLGNGVRLILTKSLTHRVSAETTGDFLQNCFPATFGGHLEFLRKMQKRVYIGNGAR